MKRYGHCKGSLAPLKDANMNETEYLIHQIRLFLDEANFDNEQMNNVSKLMDSICQQTEVEGSYAVSMHIDVNKYDSANVNTTAKGAKENRCRAIDESMDAMRVVFKRSVFNKSEPLDFSSIKFYPNPKDRSAFYNISDLINTSWIKSEAVLDLVCHITDSVKDYVKLKTAKSQPQERFAAEQSKGVLSYLMDFLSRILDPILGNQRRLAWEGSNRFEMVAMSVRRGLSSTGQAVSSFFTRANSTLTNSTTTKPVAAVGSKQTILPATTTATTPTPSKATRAPEKLTTSVTFSTSSVSPASVV